MPIRMKTTVMYLLAADCLAYQGGLRITKQGRLRRRREMGPGDCCCIQRVLECLGHHGLGWCWHHGRHGHDITSMRKTAMDVTTSPDAGNSNRFHLLLPPTLGKGNIPRRRRPCHRRPKKFQLSSAAVVHHGHRLPPLSSAAAAVTAASSGKRTINPSSFVCRWRGKQRTLSIVLHHSACS